MAISKERNSPIKNNWKCILICCAMSMANCQYGYDAATIAGFQAMVGFLKVFGYKTDKSAVGWNIQARPQQLISSFLNIGTIIGVLLTGAFARYFGRRPAIWVASMFSFIAAAVQLGSTSLGGLCVGRALLGVANGFFMTFANIYTTEVSPPHLRAVMVSFFGIWVSIGSLVGAVADNYSKEHKDKLAYQIPLASLYAIPFVLCIFVVFIPESPRWLLVQKRPEDARRALERLRGNSLTPELLDEEFIEMQRGIGQEQDLASSAAFVDMFKGTDLRRTLICIGVLLSHSSSGIWLMIAYGTYFFEMAGIHRPFEQGIWNTLSSLLGAAIGMVFTYRYFGRRSMMLIGSAAAFSCMLAMGIAFSVAPHQIASGRALIAFAIMYGFFYNGTSGTLSWPVANEVVSSRLRTLSIGLGTAINYFFSWLVTFCSPYFINVNELNWGPKYCFIWAGSNALTFVFFYFFLPEMKGRSLEELDEMFQNRVSVRNFPKYECITSEKAREIAVHEANPRAEEEKTPIARSEETSSAV